MDWKEVGYYISFLTLVITNALCFYSIRITLAACNDRRRYRLSVLIALKVLNRIIYKRIIWTGKK